MDLDPLPNVTVAPNDRVPHLHSHSHQDMSGPTMSVTIPQYYYKQTFLCMRLAFTAVLLFGCNRIAGLFDNSSAKIVLVAAAGQDTGSDAQPKCAWKAKTAVAHCHLEDQHGPHADLETLLLCIGGAQL